MEIKKCVNCGNFISSEDSLCSTCKNKITYEHTLLKNYFDENSNFDSIPSISSSTGISPSTIQNYMKENNYIDSSVSGNSFNSIQF